MKKTYYIKAGKKAVLAILTDVNRELLYDGYFIVDIPEHLSDNSCYINLMYAKTKTQLNLAAINEDMQRIEYANKLAA